MIRKLKRRWLIRQLRSTKADTRLVALRSLAQVGNPTDVDDILGLLGDDQPHIQHEAARCLSSLGASSEKFVQGFMDALRSSRRLKRNSLVVNIWSLQSLVVTSWSLQSLEARTAVNALKTVASDQEVNKHARAAAALAAASLTGRSVDVSSQHSELPVGIDPNIGFEVMAAHLIFQQAPETYDYFEEPNLRYAIQLLKRDGDFVATYDPGGDYPDFDDPIWTMGGTDGFGNIAPSSPHTTITPLPLTAAQQAHQAEAILRR